MKIFRKTAVLLLMALIVASVLSCNKADKQLTVRFGTQTFAEVILANEKGFFAEELKPLNATIELSFFQSGPPMVEALAARSLDFVGVGDQPAIQAVASGVPVKIISGLYDGTESFGLIARADSGIKGVADLKGRKIAAPAGTTSHLLLLNLLEKHGLAIEDIEFVNLANASITASLIAGDIEAATAFGLVYTNAPSEEGIIKVNSGAGYKRNVNIIAARTEFLEKNSDVSVAVLKALQKAAKFRVEHYEEALDIVANWLGTEREVEKTRWETITTLLKLNDSAKEQILISADTLFKSGILSERLTAEQLFDDRYAEAAGVEVYPGWGADKVNW